MDSQYFPNHLLIQILKWLPTKTLIKFLCVSKSWYSLITTSYFISSHLHHQQINALNYPNHLLFLLQSNFSHSILHYGQKFRHRTHLAFPKNRAGSVAGSCNGLVCLINFNNRSLSLWNPSIRKYMSLDPIPTGDCDGEHVVFGFGFDSLTNDYKVVAISYCSVLINSGISPCLPLYAQFYSINTSTWRSILLPITTWDELSYISESCFVNGVIHWILSRGAIEPTEEGYAGVVEFAASILSFDLHNESFGELSLPRGLAEAIDPDLSLAVIDNFLAVLHFVVEESEYCVWQMKDYGVEQSWMVLYRIKVPYPYLWNPHFWDKEEGKAFVTTSSGMLILFNARNQSSSVVDGEIASFGGQAFSYTESLVLLDKRTITSEGDYRCDDEQTTK